MTEHRRLALALLALYLLFAWPGPPLDPMAGRAIAQAEAFSHGRARTRGPEQSLSGDFIYPDGPAGGGVGIAEFGGPALFAPVCAATRWLGRGEPFRPTRVFLLSSLYIALLSALPAALAAACLLLFMRRERVPRAFAAAALFGASVLLPQACMVNPHGLSTFLACLSLLWVTDRERSPRSAFCAGLAAGAAVLSYFGALIPLAIPIGIYGVATGSRRARGALVLGAAGPALLLAAWNTMSYGAPWALPSLDQALGGGGLSEIPDKNLLFTLNLPNAYRLWEVSVGTRRGVFVFAPVFVLGVAGLKPLWRRRRDLALLLGAIALLSILQAAAKPISWHGGTASGPRYLLPLTVALTLPLGFGLAHYRRLGVALGGLTVFFAACTAQTALYGSLQSCLEDVVRLAPRLRLVVAISFLRDPAQEPLAKAAWISLALAIPALLLIVYGLRRDLRRPRWIAAAAVGTWVSLALPFLVFGAGGQSPGTIRLAEVQRFVRTEPQALRLGWYAGELLSLGDADGAAETALRAIERGGWKPHPVRVLRAALLRLEEQGRGPQVRRLVLRAARLKPAAD